MSTREQFEAIVMKSGKTVLVDAQDYEELVALNWYCHAIGYAARYAKVDGKRKSEYMHRRILGLNPGDKLVVDHINGNKLDNRRSNLRVCTVAQNLWNRGRQKSNTSGFKGVSWHKKGQKWEAHISAHGKQIFLGLFKTAEEAHGAYCEAAAKIHGEFANGGRYDGA